MSATLPQVSDETTESETVACITPDRVFITVAQLPNGHVSGVNLYAMAPDPGDKWIDGDPRTTVWAATVPDANDDDPSAADKVLDLTYSGSYRDHNPPRWVEGQRIASDFDADRTGERTFLRTVEAHLIRAGYPSAHTGMVQCRTFGLAFEDNFVVKYSEGWKWITEDPMDCTGMCEQPGVLAPAEASPRRLANAIIDNLACLDVDLYRRLPLRHRARVYIRTFGWRARLHRITYRLTRFRRTVRARIPR